MSKRGSDCMNEFVIKYLKKARYEKTLKLLAGKDGESKACTAEAYKKFTNYLKQKERKTKNANNDDLGFEINFGAYQQELKLPATIAQKGIGEKTGSKNESVKKEDVPKQFIKQIQRLGMKVEDAELLYKTKINWTAVYSENKLYCTEHGCEFFTKIDGDELRNHMVANHNYGEYPCPYQDCDYVGVSKVSDFKIDKAWSRKTISEKHQFAWPSTYKSL